MKIKANVSMSIFDKENIKQQSDKIFEKSKKSFQKRYDEIMKYIISYNSFLDYNMIQKDEVMDNFKNIFFEETANRAVEAIFTEDCYDLIEQIILELSHENLEKAIKGKCMIDAIANIIRQIPTGSSMIKMLNESMILQLQSHFLGITPFAPKRAMKKY